MEALTGYFIVVTKIIARFPNRLTCKLFKVAGKLCQSEFIAVCQVTRKDTRAVGYTKSITLFRAPI